MTDLSKLDEYFVDLIRIEGDLVIFNHWEAGEIQVPVSEVTMYPIFYLKVGYMQ